MKQKQKIIIFSALPKKSRSANLPHFTYTDRPTFILGMNAHEKKTRSRSTYFLKPSVEIHLKPWNFPFYINLARHFAWRTLAYIYRKSPCFHITSVWLPVMGYLLGPLCLEASKKNTILLQKTKRIFQNIFRDKNFSDI